VNLREKLKQENIILDEMCIGRLERFATLLHEWNGVHNLTGARTIEAIDDNIIDSLYPLTFIETPQSLLDVGTGAGFPGLVLAIALPQTQTVLAEPLKKRVSFLKYAAIDLGLDQVTVAPQRVETLDHAPIDLITSRAVTNTSLLLDLTAELANKETSYLFYKGSRVFDEIDAVAHQLDYDIVQKNQRNYLYIKARN
jgi:16S rRNA (guanine527-N7)-methyltransferase